MQITINLSHEHITLFKRFASMRRTLTTSIRLLELADADDINIAELLEITPAIEAVQQAIREAGRQAEKL